MFSPVGSHAYMMRYGEIKERGLDIRALLAAGWKRMSYGLRPPPKDFRRAKGLGTSRCKRVARQKAAADAQAAV